MRKAKPKLLTMSQILYQLDRGRLKQQKDMINECLADVHRFRKLIDDIHKELRLYKQNDSAALIDHEKRLRRLEVDLAERLENEKTSS